jgi:hypothetical protein
MTCSGGQEKMMAAIRILVIIGAIVLAGLAVGATPGYAQSEPARPAAAPGAPLKLTPNVKSHRAHPVRRSKARQHHRFTRRHTTPPKQSAEKRQDDDQQRVESQGTIITVPDGVSLTALLPWWRSAGPQPTPARDDVSASLTLSAAGAWFAAHGIDDTAPVKNDYALASADDVNEMDVAASGITIADASEFNEIDQALAETAAQDNSPSKSWLSILLASLGGALAVASTVRYFFV